MVLPRTTHNTTLLVFARRPQTVALVVKIAARVVVAARAPAAMSNSRLATNSKRRLTHNYAMDAIDWAWTAVRPLFHLIFALI